MNATPLPRARSQSRLWHDAEVNPVSMGCTLCPDFALCGGLSIGPGAFDCTSLCVCTDRGRCTLVCPSSPRRYVSRVREIQGFSFANVPRCDVLSVAPLPGLVPLIFHRSSRSRTLIAPVIALSLYDIVNLRTGEVTVRTRNELSERFLIDPVATLVVSGVGKDAPIERWWKLPHRSKVIEALRRLDIALITTPNFSLFTDVPRWDNLHAMKRTADTWAEFASTGLPTALHVNARTDRDYERWAAFIAERSEISHLSFEFGTGAGWPDRIDWHTKHLRTLATAVGRPLTLIVRGGVSRLVALRQSFNHVVLIDTTSFPKTVHRQRAHFDSAGRIRWHSAWTPVGAPLDELLEFNVGQMRSWIHGASDFNVQFSSSSLAASPRDRDDKSRQGRLL